MLSLAIGLSIHQLVAAWKPKTDLLSPSFVTVAQFLLNHGLPDPRGFELRRAKGVTRTINFSDHEQFQFLGLVAPNKKSGIGLNGLSFVPTFVGGKVEPKDLLPKVSYDGIQYIGNFHDTDSLILMLLAIRGDEQFVANYLQEIKKIQDYDFDYLAFSGMNTVLNSRYQQAIQSFRSSHDDVALSQFENMIHLWSEFEQFASSSHLGSIERARYGSDNRKYAFPFATNSPMFKADLVRRKSKGPRIAFKFETIAQKPISEQVRALIEQLDEIKFDIKNFDFYENFRTNPIVQRLFEIGRPAVPQLLEALKTDVRLTRMPQPSSTPAGIFFDDELTVSTVVKSLLSELALTRYVTSDWLESYWKTHLDKADVICAYEALTSPKDLNELLMASLSLFQDNDHPNNRFSFGDKADNFVTHVSIRKRFSELVNFKSPSISELLFTTVSTSLPSHANEQEGHSSYVSQLALISYYWDRTQALPSLQFATKSILASLPSDAYGRLTYAKLIGQLLDARKELGDPTLLQDQHRYLNCLFSMTHSSSLESSRYFLDRAGDPAIAPMARKLFFDAASQQCITKSFNIQPLWFSILGTPIIFLKEGRAFVDSQLADQSQLPNTFSYQTISKETGGAVQIIYDNLRTCDCAASAITQILGSPEFKLTWPIEKRTKALDSIRKFLNTLQPKDFRYRFPF